MKTQKEKILEIDNLAVSFYNFDKEEVNVVHDVSFDLLKGETLAIVGESGSGKSITAFSILGLLPKRTSFHPSGSIKYIGDELIGMPDREIRKIRGNKISMIFQEPMTSLNPLHNIGKQLHEAISLHQVLKPKQMKEKIDHLLSIVQLDLLKDRLNAYPHELSGGQRQRIMIAMALANEPDILIADEPTTALDVTVQASILQIIKDLQNKMDMSVILITHDLTIVENIADRVVVMHQGTVVENGDVKDIFTNPQDDYTKELISSAPSGDPVDLGDKEYKDLLTINNIKVHFPIKKGLFNKTVDYVKAVDDIDLCLKRSHTLGIVGESGSGKSTLAYAILRLISSQGKINFDGRSIDDLKEHDFRQIRKKIQIVFQDPFASLNPRMTIEQIISEGLVVHHKNLSKEEIRNHVDESLRQLSLDTDIKSRYPHEFSGGQRQRICIARALILKPELIIFDEPTSALDITNQSQIIDMMKELQKEHGLSYIFISHDLRVIKAISHDIIVMKNGKIIEKGTNNEIFTKTKMDYTKKLISTALNIKL